MFPSSSSDPLEATRCVCVCSKYNHGLPHNVSSATWYRHLDEATTQEEKQRIQSVKALGVVALSNLPNSEFSDADTSISRGARRADTLQALTQRTCESLDLFNDTSLAAMQRVMQAPCNPFRQQLQSLHDCCKTLEIHIVKITAERDTILTALALAATQIILPPMPPYNPSLESIPVILKKEKIAKSGAKAKMRPSQTKNGRNLCALRWLKQTKLNGTTDKFNAYYNSLTSTQRTEYDQDTANLVASNTWNKTVCDGKIL
ncbi:hypothetical protein EDB19DRAFT_2037989 [Suillus lakei]|nr:hypothetical protein EDB19DRAFT_2037989 [Suillus lakei]